MKNFYHSNQIITALLIGISLTFWGGIFALPALGLWQISITVYLITKRSKLSRPNKKFLYSYVGTTILLASIFKLLSFYNIVDDITLLLLWMFVSAGLAFFHLYITYRIKIQNEL